MNNYIFIAQMMGLITASACIPLLLANLWIKIYSFEAVKEFIATIQIAVLEITYYTLKLLPIVLAVLIIKWLI